MDFTKKYFGDLFLTARFYGGLLTCILLFIASFYFHWFEVIASVSFFAFSILSLADYSFLFFTKKYPFATRITAGRLSNGDENKIELIIKNEFSFPVHINIIDELPEQFQDRKWKKKLNLKEKQQQ